MSDPVVLVDFLSAQNGCSSGLCGFSNVQILQIDGMIPDCSRGVGVFMQWCAVDGDKLNASQLVCSFLFITFYECFSCFFFFFKQARRFSLRLPRLGFQLDFLVLYSGKFKPHLKMYECPSIRCQCQVNASRVYCISVSGVSEYFF